MVEIIKKDSTRATMEEIITKDSNRATNGGNVNNGTIEQRKKP